MISMDAHIELDRIDLEDEAVNTVVVFTDEDGESFLIATCTDQVAVAIARDFHTKNRAMHVRVADRNTGEVWHDIPPFAKH